MGASRRHVEGVVSEFFFFFSNKLLIYNIRGESSSYSCVEVMVAAYKNPLLFAFFVIEMRNKFINKRRNGEKVLEV